ncbi:hypothetical protein KKC45_00685 [Patescibacteria group bacterium]|nr:hypothetical protein [Patescibacteria group bacterium]
MEILWEAIEYEYKKRTADWFWALWIISAAIIFISVMFGSSLFAVLVFVASFTLSLQAVRKPGLIKYKINESGIIVTDKIYPYKNIESYYIKNEEIPKIILKLKSKYAPFVVIPLTEEVNISKIEGLLLNHLEKEELGEPITNKLIKYF